MKKLIVNFDGSCRNVKGELSPAFIGLVFTMVDDKQKVSLGHFQVGFRVDNGTNNTAEAQGLLTSLEICKHLHQHIHFTKLQILTDSELICKQFKGVYQSENLTLASIIDSPLLLKIS